MHACEMHAHEMHACEIHAHEIHAREMHAHEVTTERRASSESLVLTIDSIWSAFCRSTVSTEPVSGSLWSPFQDPIPHSQ